MYAKARRGELKDFTGIDDVYEIPESAELVLDTIRRTADENAHRVIEHLRAQGFIRKAVHEAK
jgi:adenylylsulfate kinase-like enzyme